MPPTPSSPDEPRRRLLRALVPRGSRGELLAGLLCAVLGFALVVQVRQTQEADLGSLRESDLVRILDDLGERNDRLEAEQAELVRVRWTAAAQRTKALERLRERHVEALRHAEAVAEERAADDLVTGRAGRAAAARPPESEEVPWTE